MNLNNEELFALQQMVHSAVRGRTMTIETHKKFGRNVSLASQRRLELLKEVAKKLELEMTARK